MTLDVPGHLRPRGRGLSLVPFILLALLCFARAQPFVAGGGFGKPVDLAATEGATFVALATGNDGATVYWKDETGIMSRPADASEPAKRLVQGRGVRDLDAVEVLGSPALAWSRRDLATGRTEHWLDWKGERRLLFEALQPYDLSLAASPDGPVVLVAGRTGAVNALKMIGWDGSEAVVRESDLSLVRYRAAFDAEGVAHVTWLEGFTDRSAVGFAAAEWWAYATTVRDGFADEAVRLGAARYVGTESQTAIDVDSDGGIVLWPGPDGEVLAARPGGAPAFVGSGAPVAVEDGLAYWFDEASLRSTELAPSNDGGIGGTVNVAWSPVTIQGAELAMARGVRHLALYGPSRGGGYRVLASDDSKGFRPSARDRIAATMGWNPWGFWEAVAGQLLGSLVLGMVVTLGLSPLLWLASAAAVRAKLGRRPLATGMVLGSLLVLTAFAVAATRSGLAPEVHEQLFGTVPLLAGSLLLAALITWLVRRRADSEQMIGVLATTSLFVMLSVSSLAFLTFQNWLDVWSSIS